MSDKLCINCRHYNAAQIAEYDKCMREQKYDLVRGEKIGSTDAYCDLERSHNWLNAIVLDACGKNARFYAPKPTGPTYMRLWERHCAEIAKAEGGQPLNFLRINEIHEEAAKEIAAIYERVIP